MKHLLLLLAAASLAANSYASDGRFKLKTPAAGNGKAESLIRGLKAAEAAQPVWRATTQTISEWDGEVWQAGDKHSVTYDRQGRITVDLDASYMEGVLSGYSRETRTYTDGFDNYTGRLVEESADGVSWDNVQKVERAFDPTAKSVVVSNHDYQWDGLAWSQTGNNYHRDIVRDAKGNVTSVTISVLFQGVFDPTEKLTIEYGDNGMPTSMKHEMLSYDGTQPVWQVNDYFTDMVWDRFNGQVTAVTDIYSPDNRVSSYKMMVERDGNMGDVSVVYPDDAGSYTLTVKAAFSTYKYEGSTDLRVTDENGSFTLETTSTYIEEGNIETNIERSEEVYDAYGLQLKLYGDYNGEVMAHSVGEAVYDTTYGYPLSFTQKDLDLDSEDGEVWNNVLRIDFADYVDVAGVSDVIADEADTPAEYYDLRGIRVDKPSAGNMYICRQGAKVSKVVVR